jgi:S-methylmethionine-dependent homocysteine/selenocysteine methylase
LEDCYRPDLVPSDRELNEEHEELATRLAEDGVDFILLETMNTIREAFAACKAAKATGKEAVVSFICNHEGTLLGGESLREAVRTVSELSPTAFSINCVSPRYVGDAIAALKLGTEIPVAVYGNVGSPESDRHGWEFTHDVSEGDYGRFASEWQSTGASIIGGCCGTTPAYIHEVVRRCKGA